MVNVEDETDNSLGRPKIEVETDHNSTTTLQKFLSSTTEFYHHHHQESLSIVSRTLNYEMNPKHNQGVKKTFNPNFENVISELWKRYIRTLTLKTLHPNFETLYPNWNISAKKLNKWTKKVDHPEWTEKKLATVIVGVFP